MINNLAIRKCTSPPLLVPIVDGSRGKALGYELDNLCLSPDDKEVEIFLQFFMSRLTLEPTQSPTKWAFPWSKDN